MLRTIAAIQPLWEALTHQAIPQARQDTSFLLPALPSLKQMSQLPDSISIKPRAWCGERIAAVSSSRVQIAHWPEDHLEATRFPSLCYVLSGRAAFHIADYELSCPAGTFLFIPPEVPRCDGSIPHVATSRDDDFSDLLWFYRWEGGVIFHICHSRGQRHWYESTSEHCFVTGSQTLLYFDLLAQEVASDGEGHKEICRSLLATLLMILQRDLSNNRFIQHNRLAQDQTPAIMPGEDPILYAQNYMRNHLDKPLTIGQVAAASFMSRSRFTRQFRLATGKSFIEYLTELRLKQAKTLLKTTDWSVELVGRHVGLKPAHFWSLFRQCTGSTPSEYRRQERQD